VQALSSAARPMTIRVNPFLSNRGRRRRQREGQNRNRLRQPSVATHRSDLVGIVQGPRSTYACSSRISVTCTGTPCSSET
jgi:hypothetical protein